MPVPFETLIPYAIITAMFGVSGAGVATVKYMQNGGKRARRSIDQWDRQMMDRDRRLTGFLRGQSDNPIAPPGFELNNPWRVWRHPLEALHDSQAIKPTDTLVHSLGRETDVLKGKRRVEETTSECAFQGDMRRWAGAAPHALCLRQLGKSRVPAISSWLGRNAEVFTPRRANYFDMAMPVNSSKTSPF
ncbi:hypothetical protein RB595_001112 [Gaeumannomyces hyphopodioides]